MPSSLHAITFAAQEPQRLLRFWSALLHREVSGDALLPPEDTGYRIRFLPTDKPKTAPNKGHFDLTSSSLEDQRATVARALELGASHLDIGQGDVDHVVLADPEGNEFDVIEPGNNFLAGTGFIGALAGDGTQEVGYFWSAALDWPLVWDQDQETAIQSPHGGTKITWGGPPVQPATELDRVHFELAAGADIDRLVSLGAKLIAPGLLTDPDGNQFTVLA